MIIKCISNKGKDLPTDCFMTRPGEMKNSIFESLTVGNYYVVYAMTLCEGYIWYATCEENDADYPWFYPSPLFSIVNGHLSKYWIYSFIQEEKNSDIWTYPEWANDLYYYNRLTDWNRKDVNIFKHYKKLMDLEFPNPSIPESDKATSLDENWLMCHFCIDAWQTDSKDGMVICPTCQRTLHNPLYEDKLIKFDFETDY